MKITFAYWGNYTIAFISLFQKLGINVIPPEKTNQQSIIEGAKISPEMYCFPLKANIGNYLTAIKKGADTVFMVTSLSGSCRLRYYGIIQDKVLSEAGYKVNFVILNQNFIDIYQKLKKISGASFWQIVKAVYFFFKKLHLIEKLEKKAQYLRPREKIKGQTDQILRETFPQLEKVRNLRELTKLKREIKKKISEIEIDSKKNVPRIGIIGEIFTVTDGAINFGIEEKLGKQDIEVHREMDVTYHLKKIICPWKDWQIQKKINPYLKSTVGGHGRDAIFEMLNYTKNNFDGIIHLLPFGCMPEVVIRPILEKIHQETGIPFLSLSLDEQVAEAGINTRLEAFVDVVKNHYNNKNH
ncbi:2-hydroxyacyl-CoA dehydratase [Candidatus Parcubacteria bacterium]|nr:2-hydroxyacyl-CoA dehydratase [Candidatus Parcubacteria bacterium]